MKATDLPMVTELIARRQKLQDMVDAAELGLINLSVGTVFVGEDIKAVCRPAIICECRAQMAAIEKQLATYGIEVD